MTTLSTIFSLFFFWHLLLLPVCQGADFSGDSTNWDPAFHLSRAKEHLKGGRLAEFKKELKTLKLLAPNSQATLALEVRLLEMEENWSQILLLTGANPGISAEAKVVRAKALIAIGKGAEAEKILKQSAKPDTSPELLREIWETYGDLAANENRKDAEKYYRNALDLSTINPSLLLKISKELARWGNAKEAAELLFPLTEMPGAAPAIRFQYVSYLEQSGQLAKVGQTLQGWIARYPHVRWQELSYANLLEKVDEVGEASAIRSKWGMGLPGLEEPDKEPIAEAAEERLIVQAGDTLQSLSEKLYGTTKRWRDIQNANTAQLQGSSRIFPGMELSVPQNGEEPRGERSARRAPTSAAPLLLSPSEEAAIETHLEPGEELETATRGTVIATIGPQSAGNSLAGTGYQSEAQPELGSRYSIQSAYYISPAFGLALSASRSSSTYASLAGLTPSSLVVSQQSIQAGVNIKAGRGSSSVGWVKNIELGLGWRQQERDAAATRPNVVVSAYRALGPVFSVASQDFIYRKISARARASLFLPTKYSERNTRTGNYDSARGLEIEVVGLYPLFDHFSASAGISYNNFKASFSGSGNRGASGASETTSTWALPIGLQWGF